MRTLKKNKNPHNLITVIIAILTSLILLIPSITFAPKNNYIVLQIFHKNNYIAIATGLLMLLWIGLWIWLSLRHKEKSKDQTTILHTKILSPISLSWLLVILWASLSYLWSDSAGHFLEKAFFFWAAGFIFYICHFILQDQRYRTWLLYALFFAAVGVSFYGIIQYTFGYSEIIGRAHPSSTFGNRNVSSHIIVLILPLLFYCLVGKKHSSTAYTLLLLSFLMVMFTYIFMTTARGPWFSVFIATAIFLLLSLLIKKQFSNAPRQNIWQNISKKNLILLALFIIIGVLLSCLKYNKATAQTEWFNPLSTIQENINQSTASQQKIDSSAAKRFITWKTIGLKAFSDKPVTGHGLGSFPYIAEKYFTKESRGMYSLHNDHIQFSVELGAIGSLLILFAILCTLYGIVKLLLSSSTSTSDKLLVIALFASFTATAFNSFFSFPYQHAAPTITLAVLLAYTNSLYLQNIGNKEKQTNSKRALTLKTTIHLALIPFALLMISIPMHWNKIYWTFEQQLKEKRWKDIDYQSYSYNRYVRSMLRTTMRSYGKRRLDRQRLKASGNFLEHWPHSEGLARWAAQVALKKKDYKAAAKFYTMSVTYAPKGDISSLKRLDAIYRTHLKSPEKTLEAIELTLERHSIKDLASNEQNFLDLGKIYERLKKKDKALKMYELRKEHFPK